MLSKKFIHNGSSVHGCLMHLTLLITVQKIIDRGLPLPVFRFLSSWYSSDESSLGEVVVRFFLCVYYGVRQGGVLSPVLVSVYLDC